MCSIHIYPNKSNEILLINHWFDLNIIIHNLYGDMQCISMEAIQRIALKQTKYKKKRREKT